MAKYAVLGLGAKYAGRCVCCGRDTGSRSFELAATLLLRDGDGKYRVAHPVCAGVQTKSAIGGGTKVHGALPDAINA